ncbi:MAG TPA: formyltransferase family protein [Candidatus Paceibacterota bacterium]|nr:formyltransferase family protein [Candidatus Paceibacterota bacterium]
MHNHVLLFATGTETGGATGARSIVETLHADPRTPTRIVGLVTNIKGGGAEALAREYDLPYICHDGGYTAEDYRGLFARFPDFDPERGLTVLCGWNKVIRGHVPHRTLNPHPGSLPQTRALYDRAIHEQVIRLRLPQTHFYIHYATPRLDDGPYLFRKRMTVDADDTPELLRTRMQQIEHTWLSRVIEMVFSGEMGWNGGDPETVWGSISC